MIIQKQIQKGCCLFQNHSWPGNEPSKHKQNPLVNSSELLMPKGKKDIVGILKSDKFVLIQT